MGAVLVAGDDDAGDPVVRDWTPIVVGLGDHRVHSLQRPFGDARRLTEPGGRRDHEDLGGDDLLAHAGPLVALAEVRFDPRRDLVVGQPALLGVDAARGEHRGHDVGEGRRVGALRRTLQGAVEDRCPHSTCTLPGRSRRKPGRA
jgi:hypothetical protein